jgi:hypothetical protein
MIPIFDGKRLDSNHLYPTLFGFSTRNKLASNLLNYVYGVVMVVATAFAFHALGLILSEWNKALVFLASLAVVGLPYCIKIVLFGNERFEPKHAYLCLAISILPGIFDFVGFYSETSVKQSLVKTKFEVVEKINYFNTEAREVLQQKKTELTTELSNKTREINDSYSEQKTELTRSLTHAQQTAIDEKEGVRKDYTSGKPGAGPRAREFDAEIRRISAGNDIEIKRIDEKTKNEIKALEVEYKAKFAIIDEGIQEINNLISSDNKNKGLLFQLNNTDNYNDLSKICIVVNNSISNISSKLGVEPKFVSYETDDVIKLSFGALFRGEITALVCFLLAVLLEMVDTIIVFYIRDRKPEDKVEEEQKSKLFFKVYDKVQDTVKQFTKNPVKENVTNTANSIKQSPSSESLKPTKEEPKSIILPSSLDYYDPQ